MTKYVHTYVQSFTFVGIVTFDDLPHVYSSVPIKEPEDNLFLKYVLLGVNENGIQVIFIKRVDEGPTSVETYPI